MKKISIYIIIFLCLIFTCSCSTKQTQANAFEILEKNVAFDLEQIDENFDDETLKTLSVIFRTNHKIKNDYINFNSPTLNKYENIVNKTKNEVLKDGDDLAFISIYNNDENWSKKIFKSDILSYAEQNNISLSNVSDIKTNFNDDQLQEIIIANRNFNFKKFANNFHLNSNKITNIENNKNNIIISGKGTGFYKNLDIEKIKEKSKNNNSYKMILNEIFDNLEVKK